MTKVQMYRVNESLFLMFIPEKGKKSQGKKYIDEKYPHGSSVQSPYYWATGTAVIKLPHTDNPHE